MISHVASECRRLGLHYAMENCPGWSMSGGPWIKPENAMRELIWSSMNFTGGQPVDVVLPVPQPSRQDWCDYRDIAVLAFPTPEGDVHSTLVPAKVPATNPDMPGTPCWPENPGSRSRSPSRPCRRGLK